ncbi:MAG TPA: flagellar export chaperone FliS [Candidatus Acidoferrum sp.]|nr:flagellar export chaperone FliS [Candidatus Acidoferrum sp.]
MTNPRTAYRENDVRGATAIRLIVLLYEQLVQDLSQALQAIEQNDIELRTKRINHAILVIGHLQSPLDFVNGGKVAQDLDHFYNVLRQNLVQVQFHPSRTGLSQQITDLLAVREAWTEVERTEKALAATAVTPTTVPSGADSIESDPARAHWKV